MSDQIRYENIPMSSRRWSMSALASRSNPDRQNHVRSKLVPRLEGSERSDAGEGLPRKGADHVREILYVRCGGTGEDAVHTGQGGDFGDIPWRDGAAVNYPHL